MEYKTIKVESYYDIPKEGAYHVILPNGSQFWCLNGQRHREDGPAAIYADGTQFWFLNGQRHRKDGPAFIYADGSQKWYLNGKCHREDGPAAIYADGTQEWYLNDQRHREDGPAIIYANGNQFWCLNGQCHREDGPAAIYASGTQEWYINNQLHRENGPARIWANGNQEWYLNGIQVSQKAIENPKALTINEIMEWDNVEGQREMINIYGLEKFIFDSNPEIINIDYHDQNGHRVLLKINGIEGQWLCCSCPSTGRTYFMRVPDRIETCEKADEWLSGSLKAKQVGRT